MTNRTKSVLRPLAVAAVLVLGACGGGGGGGSGGPGPAPGPTTYARYAFVANDLDGTISVYSVDPTTGMPRHRTYVGKLGINPRAIAVDPTNSFVFVGFSGSPSNLQVFPFDTATGALGTPKVSLPSAACTSIGFDPAGKHVYCTNGTAVYGFAVDTTGSLTPLAGSPYTGGTSAGALAVDPSGKFVYVSDQTGNKIFGFKIDAADGTLSPIGSYDTGAFPWGISVDRTGNFVYVANANGAGVSAFRISAASGELTPIDADAGTAGVQSFAAEAGSISVSASPSADLLYVGNTSGSISEYKIDSATGVLTPLAGSPYVTGTALYRIAVDPSGRFIYSADYSNNMITAYAIDTATGAVSKTGRVDARSGPDAIAFSSGTAPVTYTAKAAYVVNAGSGTVSQYDIAAAGTLSAMTAPTVTTGSAPHSIATDPFGRFAFVPNYSSNDVSVYAINADTHALTEVAGSPFAAGTSPTAVSVDPSGRFLYVSNYGWPSVGTVSAYTIDATTGALSAVSGSPFGAGNGSDSVDVDPSGRFLYVANLLNDTISAYSIDSTSGALTRLDADAVTAGTQDLVLTSARPVSIAADATGRFVYVATACGNTWVFGVNASTGLLSRVDSAAGGLCGAYGNAPNTIAVDPAGRYLFAADYSLGDALAGYAIDSAAGTLTAVTGSPFTTGSGTVSDTVDISGRYVYAAGSAGVYPFKIGSNGSLSALAGGPVAAESGPSSIVTTGTVN